MDCPLYRKPRQFPAEAGAILNHKRARLCRYLLAWCSDGSVPAGNVLPRLVSHNLRLDRAIRRIIHPRRTESNTDRSAGAV